MTKKSILVRLNRGMENRPEAMIILFILSELWKKVPEEEDESEEDEKPLTKKEQKARLKAEKEQAKEDARNARLEEKAAKKRGTPVQEADHDFRPGPERLFL